MFQTVLRIHLILMRIRILDPHWKKTDPDPGHEHSFKIYRYFNRRIFKLFFLLFPLILMQQLDETFREKDISDNFIFCQFRFEFSQQKILCSSFWLILSGTQVLYRGICFVEIIERRETKDFWRKVSLTWQFKNVC